VRENNLDLLRIVAAVAIIALHAGSGYADEYAAGEPAEYFIVGNFYHAFTRFAVPCFVMLSGALLLREKNRDFRSFYRRSWQKLGKPLLAASVFYVIYSYLVYAYQGFHQGTAVDWQKPLWQWLTGNPFFHLWYMYMLAGLYLLVPWLIRLKERLSRRAYWGLAAAAMAGGIIANLFYVPQFAWGLLSLYYVGYLLWGDVLHTAAKGRSALFFLGGIIFLTAIFFIKTVQVLDRADFLIWFGNVLDPLNALCAAASLLLFKGFCRLKFSCCVRNMANQAYNVYLIHAFWLHFLWNVIKIMGWKGEPLIVLPLLITATAVLSYAASIALAGIFGKKLNNKN
jgi:surface polysaccharide O-acyltransferase-like enzyme